MSAAVDELIESVQELLYAIEVSRERGEMDYVDSDLGEGDPSLCAAADYAGRSLRKVLKERKGTSAVSRS